MYTARDLHGRPALLTLHTTRLFPRGRGADAYVVTGIAARCDWVVLSDRAEPLIHLHRNIPTETPRHIFLSLRNPFDALRAFATQILPRLQDRFVLVSGSEDVTVPHQRDQRWRRFNALERGYIQRILNHPLLVHWFAENLDDDADLRMSPLPTGMVFSEESFPEGVLEPVHQPLANRPLRILCAHRTRPYPQWDLRRQVTELARTAWAPWCTVLDEEISETEYMAIVRQHAFVFCVEGGGLDPAPKAWQTILHGAVPIVRTNPTSAAYADLPVAFVPHWSAECLTEHQLLGWRARFSQQHDVAANRASVMARLGADYWWTRIAALARA